MCSRNLLRATSSAKFRQEVGRRGRRLERGFFVQWQAAEDGGWSEVFVQW